MANQSGRKFASFRIPSKWGEEERSLVRQIQDLFDRVFGLVVKKNLSGTITHAADWLQLCTVTVPPGKLLVIGVFAICQYSYPVDVAITCAAPMTAWNTVGGANGVPYGSAVYYNDTTANVAIYCWGKWASSAQDLYRVRYALL